MSLMTGVPGFAGDLEKNHSLLFGKVSYVLPEEVFTKPRSIARLINPGITEEYRYEDTGNASAVIVITKIREDYPKDDSLLDKIVPKNKAMQRQFGEDVVLLRTVSNEGSRIEELVFLNAQYDQTSFPYGIGGSDLHREVDSLGISMLFVEDELLIECAMHVRKKAQETRDVFIERARTLCSKWQKTVKAEKMRNGAEEQKQIAR